MVMRKTRSNFKVQFINMKTLFTTIDVVPVKGKDVYIYDDFNNKYLDLYGGHAVIPIGHSEKYVKI